MSLRGTFPVFHLLVVHWDFFSPLVPSKGRWDGAGWGIAGSFPRSATPLRRWLRRTYATEGYVMVTVPKRPKEYTPIWRLLSDLHLSHLRHVRSSSDFSRGQALPVLSPLRLQIWVPVGGPTRPRHSQEKQLWVGKARTSQELVDPTEDSTPRVFTNDMNSRHPCLHGYWCRILAHSQIALWRCHCLFKIFTKCCSLNFSSWTFLGDWDKEWGYKCNV